MATSTDNPGSRRVTIDLTPAAAAEVDRIRDITGQTTAALFRMAMSLLRLYIDALQQGKEFRVVDPKGKGVDTALELGLAVSRPTKE